MKAQGSAGVYRGRQGKLWCHTVEGVNGVSWEAGTGGRVLVRQGTLGKVGSEALGSAG